MTRIPEPFFGADKGKLVEKIRNTLEEYLDKTGHYATEDVIFVRRQLGEGKFRLTVETRRGITLIEIEPPESVQVSEPVIFKKPTHPSAQPEVKNQEHVEVQTIDEVWLAHGAAVAAAERKVLNKAINKGDAGSCAPVEMPKPVKRL